MFIGLGLEGSSLEAKGGIVGGTIELSKIDTFGQYIVYFQFNLKLICNFNVMIQQTFQKRIVFLLLMKYATCSGVYVCL